MATMAALLPGTTFSTSPSPPQTSPATFHRTVASQVPLRASHRISASSRCGRHGRGSTDMFSGAAVSCQSVPGRSDSNNIGVNFCFDIEQQLSADESSSSASDLRCTGLADWFSSCREPPLGSDSRHGHTRAVRSVLRCNCTSRENQDTAGNEDSTNDADEDPSSGGVAVAVKILKFYKREISPLLPGSCRFVPTCSEYGMQAFKKYGVVKGAILTAWRLSRCNPLGGSGFDPPRWFDESRPPPY